MTSGCENKDIFGQEIAVGDYVAYAPAAAYAGISVGIVMKFTPQNFGIKALKGGLSRRNLYYTKDVIKLDFQIVEKTLKLGEHNK